jgi:hypothetical protein
MQETCEIRAGDFHAVRVQVRQRGVAIATHRMSRGESEMEGWGNVDKTRFWKRK